MQIDTLIIGAGAAGMILMLTAGLFLWIGAEGQDVPMPEARPMRAGTQANA